MRDFLDTCPTVSLMVYQDIFQIPIALKDQDKMNFICPFGTFAYRGMLFGLCNAPATFQRCMPTIFDDLIEDIMEFFMDDFFLSL